MLNLRSRNQEDGNEREPSKVLHLNYTSVISENCMRNASALIENESVYRVMSCILSGLPYLSMFKESKK